MSEVSYPAVIGNLFVENLKLRERINQLMQEIEKLKEENGRPNDSQ